MSKQIIQQFWNFPGVLGITIIKERLPPYFYVKEILPVQKQQAVLQNILQEVKKADVRLEFFEFQVSDYQACSYKLNPQLTIVILTHANTTIIKLLAANQLQAVLQEDINEAITTFEFLTKDTPQTQAATKEVKVTIEDLIKALNALSKFSSNYMGVKLTVSYLQSTRPNFEWLSNFQINSAAKIVYSGAIAEPITALEHEWVKEWTAAFIKRCSQIVQDLPTMIEQKGLDEQTKRLLLTSLTN